MTVVSTPQEFQAAIIAAQPGGTILMAPGPWPVLAARRRRHVGPPVLIRALERRATVVAGADLNEWGGYSFEGLCFAGNGAGDILSMGSSADITFDDCTFGGGIVDPWSRQDKVASVRNARRIAFRGCDMAGLRQALVIRGSEDVTVEACRLSHMREGLQLEGSRRVWIVRNEFSEWHPNYGKGEHPDMIQFYTRNEPGGNEDVEIADNSFFAGGQRPVQVIFIRSEDLESGRKPNAWHRNIRVLRNLIYSSHKWAIVLRSVEGAEVTANMVLLSPHVGSGWKRSADGRTNVPLTPFITLSPGVTGECRDNVAPAYSINSQVVQSGNRRGWPVVAA